MRLKETIRNVLSVPTAIGITLFASVRYFPGIVFAGIDLWVQPPRKRKLRVDHGYEERRIASQKEQDEKFGLDELDEREEFLCAQPNPPLLIINTEEWRKDYYWDDAKHKHKRKRDWFDGPRISINRNDETIYWHFTNAYLFRKEYQGSGIIGVALFSLPWCLALSPILLSVSFIYHTLEKRRGLSRHSHVLLQALRGQLDPDDEALLERALRNDWKRKPAHPVSFEEAKSLLQSLAQTIRVKQTSDICARDPDGINRVVVSGVDYKEIWWTNEKGKRVANGVIWPNGRKEAKVIVRDETVFRGSEALELAECFSSRRELRRD